MRKIEKEEEHVAYEQPDKKTFHLCIVNLVIGYDTIQHYLLTTAGGVARLLGARVHIFTLGLSIT